MIITKGLFNKVDYWKLKMELISRIKALDEKLSQDDYICIHCGVEGKHSPTGFHPKGEAIDMHFEYRGKIIPPDAIFNFVLQNWFGGIGIYTHWNNPGFHLDTGPIRTWWKKDNSGVVYTLGEFINQPGLKPMAPGVTT